MINKIKDTLLKFYDTQHWFMLISTLIILSLALGQLSWQYYTTGDLFTKGITLKGGIAVKIIEPDINEAEIYSKLHEEFPESDIEVRTLSNIGEITGLSVKIDLDTEDKEAVIDFKDKIVELVPSITIDELEENMQTISPQLGESFFSTTFKAMIISFILMALVIFISFKDFVPSFAMVLCAFADITVTMAITNLAGIKLSTAGIAAFLMIIGYSADNNVLLTTKLLQNKEGTPLSRTIKAFKTAITMSTTTLATMGVGLYFSLSLEIQQILTILLIGLVVDQIMTWIQNVAILRIYMAKLQKGNTNE